MKTKFLLLLGLVLIAVIFIFANKNKYQDSASEMVAITEFPEGPADETASCQVCGPQGLHNIEGNECPEGFVCKTGVTTTASYCVKEQEDVSICETSSEEEEVENVEY